MERKGIDMTSMMIGIFLIFMFVAFTTILVKQSTSVTAEMSEKGTQSYQINVATHQIITAPCATISPGIYSIQAVKAGQLHCINTTAALKFATDTSCSQNSICIHAHRNQNEQPAAKRITADTYSSYKESASTTISIPIALHNTTSGETHSGHVEVALNG